MIRIFALSVLAVLSIVAPAAGIELIGAMRESVGGPQTGAPMPCAPLSAQRNGNCGNYRWYNVCSGYIWLFGVPDAPGEGAGVQFGGALQPCVAPGNVVK